MTAHAIPEAVADRRAARATRQKPRDRIAGLMGPDGKVVPVCAACGEPICGCSDWDYEHGVAQGIVPAEAL
ncbi:MAG: hypothetical protein ACSLE1_03085 [Sphingobium sp.]